MKRKLLFNLIFFMISITTWSQTNATNFTANDCNGTPHDLFSVLDSGKVVVIAWVMPCASCIAGARAAHDAVQAFNVNHPNAEVFYLADDDALTSCQTLTSWGNANHMTVATHFSNVAVNPSDYGILGMPKVVVLGGSAHHVFYNYNDGVNSSGILPAINTAFLATGIETASTEDSDLPFISVENQQATISLLLKSSVKVSVDLYSVAGQLIKTVEMGQLTAGTQNFTFDLDNISNGLYFLRLNYGGEFSTLKFSFIN